MQISETPDESRTENELKANAASLPAQTRVVYRRMCLPKVSILASATVSLM